MASDPVAKLQAALAATNEPLDDKDQSEMAALVLLILQVRLRESKDGVLARAALLLFLQHTAIAAPLLPLHPHRMV